MPAYVMNQPGTPQNGMNMGSLQQALGLAGSAYAGATVQDVATQFHETQSRAAIGMWTAVGLGVVNVLQGNASVQNANSAMTAANAITAGTTYLQADQVNIKAALQQLSQGQQNQSLTGYLNISTSVQPTGTVPGGPPTVTTANNNNGVIIIGGIILAAVLLRRR